MTQTIRLRRGESHAELDWSVGPIPVRPFSANGGDGSGGAGGAAGKEVISRFSAPSLASGGAFYTDANGREFQRRVRNARPTWDLNVTQPVAGNYYPATAAAFVRDEGGGDDGIQVKGVVLAGGFAAGLARRGPATKKYVFFGMPVFKFCCSLLEAVVTCGDAGVENCAVRTVTRQNQSTAAARVVNSTSAIDGVTRMQQASVRGQCFVLCRPTRQCILRSILFLHPSITHELPQ